MLRGFTTLQSHFIKTYPDVWMYINGFICFSFSQEVRRHAEPFTIQQN